MPYTSPRREGTRIVGAQRAAAPVLSGSVPPLAASFHPRPETGLGLADGLRPGHTIVLVPGRGGDPSAPGASSAFGGGMSAAGAVRRGTGKTQLAVEFAHAMWNARAVDLLVWVPAGNRTAILASYAQAMTELDAQQPGETADAAAERFLGWLSRTNRRWAVVLDGVTSASDLDGLWPAGATGQLVVTTRLSGSELRGDDRTVYEVPGFSRREALSYLNSRLTGYPDQRIEALDLAEDLGGLPIAMAQAAAVVAEAEITCRDYRVVYSERLRNTAGTVVDGCPQALLATWSLAVEQAHELSPAGLAWPALAFASVLDTNGIPAGVLISPTACGYVTGRPSAASGGDQNLVRAAFGNLERLGLLSVDKTNAVRTVWLHPAVRAAVRAYLPPGNVEQVVAAAATALLEAWPEPDSPAAGPQLSQALRDCAASLSAYGGDLLWKPELHSLLLRAGESLAENELADSAIAYWQAIAATCIHLLGPVHAQSVLARGRLAAAYSSAGRLAEGAPVFEVALADCEQDLGHEHPDTLLARVNVARSYEASGREAEAIMLYEQTLTASERLLGPAHRETLAVRAYLAAAYQAAGRRGDSLRLYERTLAESERALGPVHRDTMTARAQLAAAHQSAGQLREAITGYQRTLADRERVQGPDHPETLATRAALANAYRLAGKIKEAVGQYERVLVDRERIQGADHPDTLTSRANLAFAYRTAGKLKDAIPQYERTLADRERVQGADHRDTLSTRANLAGAYQLAHRLNDAIPQYERAVADSERILGPGDIDTLTTRCNLATAYYEAGRLTDVATVLRRALADCQQYLGPDHPMTTTVRENLQAATKLRFHMAPVLFDYIIAGGGSAGSALANRLSSDATTRVLVLEAGRPDYAWDPLIHMPAALAFPIGSRFYDWQYSSEPEPFLGGRRIYHARGKVLGGSSSINGMIFQRGNPLDFERWAADPGMADWDYAHCLPYFKRMENCLAAPGTPDAAFRGTAGPLVLERGPAVNPLFKAFFEAVQQAGYPLTTDVNGFRQEGFAAFDRNIHHGRRLSAARAYLHPAMSRPNLRVATGIHVTRILFDRTRATGLEFAAGGSLRRAYGGEVIVCAGAFGSPQLLQLSGVGNAAELSALGIPVVADLPGVGENLQDHLEVYVQYGSKLPVSVAPALKWRNRPGVGLRWLVARSGPGATNHFEAGGFARSNDSVPYPNLMFHFLPIAIRYDGSAPAGGHGYQVHIGPMYSDSRGSVKVTSTDPFAKPALRFNYLSTPTDRREWLEAIRIARHILGQKAFAPFNDGELSPGPSVSTDGEILDWVARDAETALHPSCTCAMGTGPMSVTDPSSLRVHSVSGLRVVDASVMPYVTNGNIYAPVMMTAEKAADLITGNTPLPAEPIPFYRHKPDTSAG